MNKEKRSPGRPKKYPESMGSGRLTVYVDPVNKKWLEDQVKKNVFGGKSHGVNYSLTVLRTVFAEREEQIMQLAKSGPIQTVLDIVDMTVLGGESEQPPR